MLILRARQWFGLKEFVTMRHLVDVAKIILLTGSIFGFAYSIELFMAWYSGNGFEQVAFANRVLGPYAAGLLGDVGVQLGHPPAVLIPDSPAEHPDAIRNRDPRERRRVVLAVRDRHHVALPRIFA